MLLIQYLNRKTKQLETEKVYGEKAIAYLYGNKGKVAKFLLFLVAFCPFFSTVYGWLQKSFWSKKKIIPFIQEFKINQDEFLEDTKSFKSFNDFFIRKLKPSARPIDIRDGVAIIPADGRYLFYSHIEKADGFVIKGKKFTLQALLKDEALAHKYKDGSMVIARLCPLDYHRFHFPIHCKPSKTRLINGPLYSVNPLAIKENINIFSENKRTITLLESENQTVAFIEVGATAVGSIHQTFKEGKTYPIGAEKGFFSFGGSTLILLFEKGKITFDNDLLEASKEHIEIYCMMGQSMGRLH